MEPRVFGPGVRAFVALAIVAAAAVCADARAEVLTHGSPACHALAFTFDLCPVKDGTGFDEPLVQYLIAQKIHATFFASGTWIASHDAAVRELAAQPFFEIGAHGETHAHLPPLPAEAQRREITGPVATLKNRYGVTSTLFRPPYGEYSDETVRLADAAGLTTVMWSVVSGDPDPKLEPAAIVADVEWRVKNGSVIIFHANGRGWHTREIVGELNVRLVTGRKFSTATISELRGPCATSAGRATREVE
jgi:peptidoglycan/xylan/chitin deacetylase (PgdA/CDA1 family)